MIRHKTLLAAAAVIAAVAVVQRATLNSYLKRVERRRKSREQRLRPFRELTTTTIRLKNKNKHTRRRKRRSRRSRMGECQRDYSFLKRMETGRTKN